MENKKKCDTVSSMKTNGKHKIWGFFLYGAIYVGLFLSTGTLLFAGA